MSRLLQTITDRVSTRKGKWITLAIWVIVSLLLTIFAPSAKDYEVSRIDALPDDAQSVIAEKKRDHYFKGSDGIPAILIFQSPNEIKLTELTKLLHKLEKENVFGVKEIIPIASLPPQAAASFFADDRTIALIPLTFESSLETKEVKQSLEQIYQLVEKNSDFTLYVTGPAGIAKDSLDLFSRADIVLLLSTVGIILILLIIIYRSPFLALIPLLAAAAVYCVVNHLLGFLGKAGVPLSNQSISIMTILLFATVIDYSLFIFSRYREELKNDENKHEAMKLAMRGVGIPIFYSGATILAAMLVLFFAQFGDYQNFAPIFGTAVIVVMIASVTLVPALFTTFGRKAFWPKVPRVGDEKVTSHSLWGKVGRFVTRKPIISAVSIGIFLLVSASNIVNIHYEFEMMKSFPNDMPSRIGYDILEENFEKGDLAPTTVIFESKNQMTNEEQERLLNTLSQQPLVSHVRVNGVTQDEKVISYSMAFKESPYAIETMDALEKIQTHADDMVKKNGLNGKLYFAGETAAAVDDRSVNNQDIIVIVLLETILIFIMLIFLTKSFKMPIYMMGTILVSFLAALGLGMLLTGLFFNIDTISNRVPLYSFVFLVALGIDYNIILISRYIEERKQYPIKKAVQIAVANTGGVISSAGIILAATFAVLMTQPIELLFVFGFIVAVGILLDTFLIRGILLPSLLILFEKEAVKSKSNSSF
ncbi:MMPL family transporter [Bacillus aquiflavi]|uniref:MMPL family transporter n=2 Tax=Bacillus aquiflavi TaxID=2672567 RepID=A0A6B3VUG0_9BACI|nr:MMPL family transporter [Bacillus aquiflavi]MBA4535579.1 MMPL family transporter [Bacillus aquiflavi]NEY79955.1 MMPL family transporter [Bacillus aquiflavi]